MILYLMRHGIACDPANWRGSDFDRPLTAEGSERTRKVLAKLKKKDELQVDQIWSSPLIRALQTADIAATLLGVPVKTVDALQSGTDLQALLDYVKKNKVPSQLLCTGHEPDLGAMLGELTDDAEKDHAFKRAAVAKLEGKLSAGKMKLIWYQTPKDILGD